MPLCADPKLDVFWANAVSVLDLDLSRGTIGV